VASPHQYDRILATEKRLVVQSSLRFAFLILAALLSFYSVGFLDGERLAEGVPAITTLVQEMIPPDFTEWVTWMHPLWETLVMSVAGTAFALVLSLPLGLLAAANTSPHPVAYFMCRGILNTLRAIPELIMGILFVAAVGFGALPGALALGLHSTGMVGKFIAEIIEHIDEEPVEAVKASGSRLPKIIRYAVIPQVFSQVADITIYRWEYHFRASTVLGMVGAGGIGFELIGSLRLMRYQEVFALLIVVLVMVTLIDSFGAYLRRRLR
jgi:phosphonate transport system permease protein